MYLFCPFEAADAGNFNMRHDVRMNDGAFLYALRVSLREADVDTYRFFGTLSFMRGGVQLVKALRVPDADFKDLVFWESDEAFYAYLPNANRLEARHEHCSP